MTNLGFGRTSTSTGSKGSGSDPGGTMYGIGIIGKYSDIINEKYLESGIIKLNRTKFFHNLSDRLYATIFPKKYFYDKETGKVFQIYYSTGNNDNNNNNNNNFVISCVDTLFFSPNKNSTPLEYFETIIEAKREANREAKREANREAKEETIEETKEEKEEETIEETKEEKKEKVKYTLNKKGEWVNANEKKDNSLERVDKMLFLEDYKTRYIKEKNINNNITPDTINAKVEQVQIDNTINTETEIIVQLSEFLDNQYTDENKIPFKDYTTIMKNLGQDISEEYLDNTPDEEGTVKYKELTNAEFIDIAINKMNTAKMLEKKWEIYKKEIEQLIVSDLTKELQNKLKSFNASTYTCNKKGGKRKSKKNKVKKNSRRRTTRKSRRKYRRYIYTSTSTLKENI